MSIVDGWEWNDPEWMAGINKKSSRPRPTFPNRRSPRWVCVATGERSGRAKLTEERVRAIRRDAQHMTQQAIADREGISQAQVCRILKGMNWTKGSGVIRVDQEASNDSEIA